MPISVWNSPDIDLLQCLPCSPGPHTWFLYMICLLSLITIPTSTPCVKTCTCGSMMLIMSYVQNDSSYGAIISCHMMGCVTWYLSGESNSFHPKPQAEGDMSWLSLTNIMSCNPRVWQRFCHMVSLLIMSFLTESLIGISFCKCINLHGLPWLRGLKH